MIGRARDMLRRFLPVLALWALFAPAASLAQTAPLIIDQGRVDRAPPGSAPADIPAPSRAAIQPTVGAFTPFVMTRLEVNGSSLPRVVLDRAAAPYVGKTLTAADLARLADDVGRAYAASDIALYTVLAPRQNGEGGVARLVAVEGRVSEVAVTGDPRDPPPVLTRAYADALVDERPLKRSALERQLGLMRDVAGAKLDVQLLQGSQPGAVRLAVKTPKDRLQASIAVNNRGSAFLGRTQVEFSLTGSSLVREGDQTRLTLAAPTDWERFQYVALSHSEPLGASGATLSLSAGRLRTRPNIAGFTLTGQATTAQAQVSYPLIRANAQSLYLTGGLDGVDSDNALFGRRISQERSRAVRAAASYSKSSAAQALSASLALSRGIDGLGARAPGNGAPSDFSKLNAQAGLSRKAGPAIVRLSGAGQYAATRLPASEQYVLGGAQFGRAFAAAVASGDSGYGVSAEVAWRPTVGPKRLAGTEVYGFGDRGEARMRGGGRGMIVASAGAGVRIAWAGRGMLELEAAKPLDAPRGLSRAPQLMINLRSML